MNYILAPKYLVPKRELDKNNTYSMKNRPTSQYLGKKSRDSQFKNLRDKIVEC